MGHGTGAEACSNHNLAIQSGSGNPTVGYSSEHASHLLEKIMAESSNASQIAKLRVVYELPNSPDISVRSNVPYATSAGETLTVDLYRPALASGPLPVVLFVTGYSDVGMR